MAIFNIPRVRISAICSCVPKKIERTADYDLISEQERELFIKTTGIKERRVAAPNVTCSDLCFVAAEKVLENIDRAEIDGVLFVSQSPDYYLPATSVLMQDRLKLKKDCLAFDVSLGCSGYIYGLSVAATLLQNGQLKKILLLVGDKSTFSTNYHDKSTYPLFGDAGTASLLEYDPKADPLYFNLQSDGSGMNAIMIEDGQCRNPYSADSEKLIEIEPGIARRKKDLILNGIDVFNFSLREVAPNITAAIESSGMKKEEIDFFVLHQANKLMNESVRKKLKIDAEKAPYSLEVFGNTSSASIPLTLCYTLKNELKNKKLNLVLCGFGVGFSWGTVVLKTEHVDASLVEYDRS